ncbi:uncharacterized protein ASCRUDRAFT_76033 [Ascoidea rubescens DSM 1968]|uniref:Uncharacterized protein n=1 Tax=Ascoidea rubescens DSM 1968 TaxID=1344418 RepID=A0A1D2VGD9_9ASCO|nr:hypothetical protein ASCRUDRAFT_76033 [Ascoidea rubescens DSM 1968]ODV60652.1 hypothetical protein ASCRUDRAFT_76033 [Ascoidea rubescens DSM 1968]
MTITRTLLNEDAVLDCSLNQAVISSMNLVNYLSPEEAHDLIHDFDLLVVRKEVFFVLKLLGWCFYAAFAKQITRNKKGDVSIQYVFVG